jgi:hypothetical protein
MRRWPIIGGSKQDHIERIEEAAQELRAELAAPDTGPAQYANVQFAPPGGRTHVTVDDLNAHLRELEGHRQRARRESAINANRESQQSTQVAPEFAAEERQLRKARLAGLEARKQAERDREEAELEQQRAEREERARQRLRAAGATPAEVNALFKKVMQMELLDRLDHPEPAPNAYKPLIE